MDVEVYRGRGREEFNKIGIQNE